MTPLEKLKKTAESVALFALREEETAEKLVFSPPPFNPQMTEFYSGPHAGVVNHVNNTKGFGFISCPDFDKDVYFSVSLHQQDLQRRLRAGALVDFSVYRVSDRGRKGLRALVKCVEQPRRQTPQRRKW